MGRYANDEPPVSDANIDPRIHFGADDLAALLFQAWQIGKRRDVLGRAAEVRW
jgi:hypothetical protein